MSGTVVIQCIVTKVGEPRDCRIEEDLPGGMGQAALQAVQAQRFSPALENGEPVAVLITLPIRVRRPAFDRDGIPEGVREFSAEEMSRPMVVSGPYVPRVPTEARQQSISGLVIIRCILAVTGVPQNCYIRKDMPYGIGAAVLEMVEQQRYSPPRDKNGRAIAVALTIPIQVKIR